MVETTLAFETNGCEGVSLPKQSATKRTSNTPILVSVAQPPRWTTTPPKSRPYQLAARLVDPERSPFLVEREARHLTIQGLGTMLQHIDRLCALDGIVLNDEQRGVIEVLGNRLEALEGDGPGGEA